VIKFVKDSKFYVFDDTVFFYFIDIFVIKTLYCLKQRGFTLQTI